MNEEAVKKREEAYNDYLYEFMSGYFATKRDGDAGLGQADEFRLLRERISHLCFGI